MKLGRPILSPSARVSGNDVDLSSRFGHETVAAYGRQIYRCCHAQLNTAPQISGVKTRTTVERFESEPCNSPWGIPTAQHFVSKW